MNLDELAQAIKADRSLCRRVITAAIRECGWPALTLEQAIVLLGRERLAAQFLHFRNTHRMAQAGDFRPPRPFQEEAE